MFFLIASNLWSAPGKIFPGEPPVGRDKVFPPKKAGESFRGQVPLYRSLAEQITAMRLIGTRYLGFGSRFIEEFSLQVHGLYRKNGWIMWRFLHLRFFCRSSALRKKTGISEAASVLRYLAVLGGVSIFGISVVHYHFSGSVKSYCLGWSDHNQMSHSPWASFCWGKSLKGNPKKTGSGRGGSHRFYTSSSWLEILVVCASFGVRGISTWHGPGLGAIWGWWVGGVEENCHGVFSFWNNFWIVFFWSPLMEIWKHTHKKP